MSDTPINRKLPIYWAAITLLYVLVRVNIVNIPLDRDEGIFGYIGQVILDHGLPYRDGIENKPPVVYYLNALALMFFKPTPSGVHLFLHFYNYLTMISLFFFSKTYFRSTAAGLWTALTYSIFSAEPAIQGFTASTEMFLLLPLSLCLLFAALAARKDRTYYMVLSGMAGALAFWTKQPALFPALFVPIATCASLRGKPPPSSMLKAVTAWGVGAVGVSSAIGAYFYIEGVFPEFIYWCFTHNSRYAANTLNSSGEFLISIKRILKGDFIIVGVGLVSGLAAIVRRDANGWFVLGFMAFSLLAAVPGAAYAHYFAQTAPSVAIAAGFGASHLIDTIPRGRKKFAAALAALVVCVPLAVNRGYYFEKSPFKSSRDRFAYQPFPESLEVADFIARRTTPDDSVFILGSEAQILFYSQRKSATPFGMFYPLTAIYPRYMEFQKRVFKEVKAASPRYIIVVKIPTSWMWDTKADLWILDAAMRLIERDYYLEAVMLVGGERGLLLPSSQIKNQEEFDSYLKGRVILIYRKR